MNNYNSFLNRKLEQKVLGDASTFINTIKNTGINEYVDISPINLGNTEDDFSFAFWTNAFAPNVAYETIISNIQDSRPRLSMYMGIPNFSLYAEQDATLRYQGSATTPISGAQESVGKKLFTIYDKIGLNVTNAKVYINAVQSNVTVIGGRNTFTSGTAWNTVGWRLFIENNTFSLKRYLDEFMILKKPGGLSLSTDVVPLYNSGIGKDPRTIATLAPYIHKYFKFNQLYNVSGGIYTTGTAYIKEEIGNTYHALVGFAANTLTVF